MIEPAALAQKLIDQAETTAWLLSRWWLWALVIVSAWNGARIRKRLDRADIKFWNETKRRK